MTDIPREAMVMVVGASILALAFLLRIGIHIGRTPSGVDTWYYLAYADAVRRRPRLDVRLPQYLLQDEKQSYAPLFPTFLALLPGQWLRRWFWVVSPAIDCVQLGLLYWLAFRITDSLAAAIVAAAIYALTPQLVAETRSLNGRSFGALLHSVAMLLLLRYVVGDGPWIWVVLALVAGASVFLASATSSAAYGFACFALSIVLGDARYVAIATGALALAVGLSWGHLIAVVRNYFHAGRYWLRNRHRLGAHPIRDSPIYGQAEARRRGPAQHQGFLGGNTLQQLLRLLGENPFILALPFAPLGPSVWSVHLYWWAVALAVLALLATLLPPLRIFGPGRSYMKAAVFPTAYTLAIGIDGLYGLAKPVGIATMTGLALSLAAIGFFYYYTGRRVTEHTASAPPGLIEAARYLAEQTGDGLLCLPYMYADYACYNSGKRVLWGGHCGDLTRFEALSPVITRHLPELLREHNIRYVLLDRLYAQPEDIGLGDSLDLTRTWESFTLYQTRLPAPDGLGRKDGAEGSEANAGLTSAIRT